jgi:hypothetical protein
VAARRLLWSIINAYLTALMYFVLLLVSVAIVWALGHAPATPAPTDPATAQQLPDDSPLDDGRH